jgi:hypothetical protein
MPAIQSRRMNWVQSVPAWRQNAAWRDLQKSKTDDFLANTAAATNSFATASLDQINGITLLTAKIALGRIEAAAKAKAAQSQSQALSGQLKDLFA